MTNLDFKNWAGRNDTREKRRARNAKLIFAVMEVFDWDFLMFRYNGEGDSGCCESVEVFWPPDVDSSFAGPTTTDGNCSKVEWLAEQEKILDKNIHELNQLKTEKIAKLDELPEAYEWERLSYYDEKSGGSLLSIVLSDLAIALAPEGFEVNDGSFGEILFDFENKTVTLDSNVRIIEVESDQHVYDFKE